MLGDKELKLNWIKSDDIVELNLLDFQKEIIEKLKRVCCYFFKMGGEEEAKNAPIKGFLLYGLPGTSKTELVKQVYKKVNEQMGENVEFAIVDGADIAAARWGDAENNMIRIFKQAELDSNKKYRILLFDDIDCFIMARGAAIAQEWHFSMNSIFFHQLDRLNPNKIFIFATTNRYDLVDKALISRLYPWKFDACTIPDLMRIVEMMLNSTKVPKGKVREEAEKAIEKQLKSTDAPTIRDAKQFTAFECIERGLWS